MLNGFRVKYFDIVREYLGSASEVVGMDLLFLTLIIMLHIVILNSFLLYRCGRSKVRVV